MGEAAMLFLQVLFLMWRLDGEVCGGVYGFAAAVLVSFSHTALCSQDWMEIKAVLRAATRILLRFVQMRVCVYANVIGSVNIAQEGFRLPARLLIHDTRSNAFLMDACRGRLANAEADVVQSIVFSSWLCSSK